MLEKLETQFLTLESALGRHELSFPFLDLPVLATLLSFHRLGDPFHHVRLRLIRFLTWDGRGHLFIIP